MTWWHRWTHGVWQIKSTTAWTQSVGDESPDAIMNWHTTSDYHAKQGRSTGRVVIDNALSVYLKRHWKLSWWQRILAFLNPLGKWTPAAQEWSHLNWAQQAGFRVPEPLAMGQRVGPRFTLQSYLVIRELTGMLPLHQAIPKAFAIMPPKIFAVWKQGLLQQIAEITKCLHQLHRYHCDLYLCHFYVTAPQPHDQAPAPLTLIDFHRMKHRPWSGWRWQIKDLAQLCYSMMDVPGLAESDFQALIPVYCGSQQLSNTQRWLLRAVRLKAHRYSRHNQQHLAKTRSHSQESQKAA